MVGYRIRFSECKDNLINRGRVIIMNRIIPILLGTFFLISIVLYILPKNTILLSAVRGGDLSKVNLMLWLGANPNGSDGELTPLNYAVREGHIEIVKRLIQAGANPNLKGTIGDVIDKANFAPLEDAITYQSNNLEFLNTLLQAGANPNDYFTLVRAVENRNTEVIRILLNAGANKDQLIQIAQFYHEPQIISVINSGEVAQVQVPANQSSSGNSAKPQSKLANSHQMIEAAEEGDLDKVKELVEKRSDPNSQDEDSGITPLIQASLFGHVEVVKYLLQHGANPNIKDEYGSTALDSAVHNEPQLNKDVTAINEIVKSLISAGANVNHVVNGVHVGSTVLIDASNNGYSDVVKMLLEAGADPNITDDYNNTPISLASNAGYTEIVKVLLEHGANPNVKDSSGKTPLNYAEEHGYSEIIQLLLKK